jgi:Patatin-like phospholipase
LRFTPKSLLKLALYIPISAVAHLDLLDRAMPLLKVDVEAESLFEICIRTAGLALSVAAAGLFSVASFALMFLLLASSFARVGIASNIAGAIAFLTCTWLIPSIAGFIGRHLGIASNSPLRDTIGLIDVEDVRKGNPEVICTLSSQPGYRRRKPMAFYPSLHKTETNDQATEILLQSAALPEVFPMRKVFGDDYVDGGVADNTPIFGLVGAQTRSIIIVYLDHRMNRVLELYKRLHFGQFFSNDQVLWTRSSGLRSREAPRLREIARRRGGDERWESIEDWFHGVELIPIIPSKSLGNFVTGTLNFTTRKANRLIAEGYEDTLNQIRTWCCEEPVVIAARSAPDRSRS